MSAEPSTLPSLTPSTDASAETSSVTTAVATPDVQPEHQTADTSAELPTETVEATPEVETLAEVEEPAEEAEALQAETLEQPEAETESSDDWMWRVGGEDGIKIVEQILAPDVDGETALSLLDELVPYNSDEIRKAAAWSYLDNPVNHETIAQDLLGRSAEDVQKAVEFADKYAGDFEQFKQNYVSPLSEEDRQAVEEAKRIKVEREEEKKTQAQAQVKEAYDEIFKSTVLPIDEIQEQFFRITPEDAKSPQVKELKESARMMYRLMALAQMDSDPHARQANEQLQQVLSQGLQYKDRAKQMYAPDLTRRTKAAAASAAQRVNKLYTLALKAIQSEIQEKTQARIEPASQSAGVGQRNGQRPKMPEIGTPEYNEWATRGFNVVTSVNNPKI